MGAFATAFSQFFTMFTLLFSALSKFALSIDNIADVTVSASGTYRDQALHDRQVEVNKRIKELAAPAVSTTAP